MLAAMPVLHDRHVYHVKYQKLAFDSTLIGLAVSWLFRGTFSASTFAALHVYRDSMFKDHNNRDREGNLAS